LKACNRRLALPCILCLIITASQQRCPVQCSRCCCGASKLLEPWQRSDHWLMRLQQLKHLCALRLCQASRIICCLMCCWLNLPLLHLLLQLPSAAMPLEHCSAFQAVQLLPISAVLILAASSTGRIAASCQPLQQQPMC
jgi:hypothetical protein